MSLLFLRAYWKLLEFDVELARGDFSSLYEKIRNHPHGQPARGTDSVERICAAVDVACVWYWKQVLCLQRSAATAVLLKQAGVPAQMVVGVQHMPFKAHAWVEVEGRVVNDKSYMPQVYSVLDRC